MAGALISLLSKRTPFGFQKSNGEVLMDIELVENITHNMTSDISSQIGTLNSTNDNIKNLPVELSMTCRISNTPVSLLGNIAGTISSVLPSNPLFQEFSGKYVTKLSNFLLHGSTNRRQDFFNKLLELRNNKIPFDVVSGLKVYQNMFFTSIVVEERTDSQTCLIFSVSMQQMVLKSKSTSGQTKKGFKKLKEKVTQSGSLLFETLSKFGGS